MSAAERRRVAWLLACSVIAIAIACEIQVERDAPGADGGQPDSAALAAEDTAAGASAADRQTILTLTERFERGIEARDAIALGRFYAEDARFLPPGSGPVIGRVAIEHTWADYLTAPRITAALLPQTVDVARSGEMAYEVGAYAFVFGGPGGRIEDSGKYVVVWRKVGRDWKIAVDIFNSDRPPTR